MSGTVNGGKNAAITNKLKYGESFYARIGAVGGTKGHSGGFKDKELARRAGRLGGLKSRRGKAKPVQVGVDHAYLEPPRKWWKLW